MLITTKFNIGDKIMTKEGTEGTIESIECTKPVNISYYIKIDSQVYSYIGGNYYRVKYDIDCIYKVKEEDIIKVLF
jgi:preprotein translocase subunit YajC